MADPARNQKDSDKNPNTSRGVWGYAPPGNFWHIHALRQLLVRSEENIFPQIVSGG